MALKYQRILLKISGEAPVSYTHLVDLQLVGSQLAFGHGAGVVGIQAVLHAQNSIHMVVPVSYTHLLPVTPMLRSRP